MSIDRSALQQLDERQIERYSERLRLYGSNPKTLGWDSAFSQKTRFEVACKSVEFGNRSVLDVGCGLADFCGFLLGQKQQAIDLYTGIDINPDLIQACRLRFPEMRFEAGNILYDILDGEQWDIVTMFGLLNLRLIEFQNIDYAKEIIQKAFSLTRETLIVDMLTEVADATYPQEDFVYYYQPDEMLRFALSLTPHVSIKHDYPSIPQRECMLIMRKRPCV